jgi:hypothetical protein
LRVSVLGLFSMAGIAEIIPEVAGGALVIMPELANIPVIGRLLVIAAGAGITDTQAIEKLQEQANKKKTDRKTRRDRNNRYVLKASDAMQCVENNLMDGTLLLSVVKGLANVLLGRADAAPDIILDKIWTCIEEHVLRQDTPRVKHTGTYFARPSKGHGHGRTRKSS